MLSTSPVLLIGGSGIVGVRAAAALRKLAPELPIAIAGRNGVNAASVARDTGGPTTSVVVDLSRDDLALPEGSTWSAVVVFLKDAEMRTMRYAQTLGIPYIAFADFSFDVAPALGMFIHAPTRAPIVLLGHVLGGIATLAALHFAKELHVVSSIEIAGVVGADDTGGPASRDDFERYAAGGHGALVLRDAAFTWLKDGAAARTIVDAAGIERTAYALPLLDVPSLAAATTAHSLRVDLAVRGADERKRQTELIIDLAGTRTDGTRATIRVVLTDDDVHARISAYGAAFVIERLLGLRGGPPVGPGLYGPERILEPEMVLRRLRDLGVRVDVVLADAPPLKIGILGAGNVGGALTRRLRALGHEVFVANTRGPRSLTTLARDTGAHPVSVRDVVHSKDVVILAIPEVAIASLPPDLFASVPTSTVVVDAGNYYPRHRDGRIDGIENGQTESRWVASILGRPVIKAFNNIWAHDLVARGRSRGASDRFALPIAGDDAIAKDTVRALVSELGFDVVDAGGLDDSWRQQPGTPVYTANRNAAETSALLAQASQHRPAELSGSAASPGTWMEPR